MGVEMYRGAISLVPLDEKISEIRNNESYVLLSEISDDFKNAVVSIEDNAFYRHNGVNLTSIGRAVFKNLKARSFVEGGSTITQQLAKNLYFTMDKKLERKVAELFVVYQLEKDYEKNEILELYVNVIYYGNGYFGIKNASNGYFGVNPADLSFFQSVLLAGIPQAPSIYDPLKNIDLAIKRGEEVLNSMIKNNYIDDPGDFNENFKMKGFEKSQ
jgi:membrane peptidoglycan carboxypeptidase